MTAIALHRRIPRWALPLQRPARFKGASGGRSSGKSHFYAEEAVERMVCNPGLRFVCIREVQRSLALSAKSLVESKIDAMGVSDLFAIRKTEIRRVGGRGVMAFQGMQDHTADSIKSLDGFHIAWVEEAQSIRQRSLDLLIPTIREPGSELWFSWNPDEQTDPVDVLFNGFPAGDPDVIRAHVTYRDNPFCPAVMRKEAARLKIADPEAHEHIWEGGYYLGRSGRVYSSYSDRPFPDGNVDESVQDYGGELYVGQDFNVNPMASVIAQRVGDECHVLDALEIATSNTDEVAQEMKRRYPNRRVIFCPDPAGNQRRSSTTIVGQTDFTILRGHGFEVRAPFAHPPVVDRVNNAQMMFAAGEGASLRRRVRVHPRAAALRAGLKNLKYKDGTSLRDKNGYDHICDALDYLLWQEFNVIASDRLSIGSYAA